MRVLDTNLSKALLQTRDDALELERGGITSKNVPRSHPDLFA